MKLRLLVGLCAGASLLVLGGSVASGGGAKSIHACGPIAAPAANTPGQDREARCFADVVAPPTNGPVTLAAPSGLTPAQLHSAYTLPTTASGTPTIAIVDAFDDPKAESDLGVYSTQFGLPQCTTANGCFRKVNQSGQQSSYPKKDAGWALEISLDVQVAHAICQNCKILLVEAKTNSFKNLLAAVDRAVSMGATVISNSYGAPEFSNESAMDSHFNHPGVPITVSSGDNGYEVEYPAASQYVTAVGGTTLNLNGSGFRTSETVWAGAGSGCSAFEAKPAWQSDSGCPGHRTVADVSAVADPNTGVAIYDTVKFGGHKGWQQIGGTSLSSPLIAAVYALAGNGGSTLHGSFPYANSGSLFDIVSGSNGFCGGSYLCTGGAGYDGPSGLGVPNGTAGF
jgi:subtilase family serine protease